jgi:hypothetical protein
MTPFIQSIVSNQAQKRDRIPIKGAVIPINPVKPKPSQVIPRSQTHQSHPIPPDIIIDTDIQLPIHKTRTTQKFTKRNTTISKTKPPKK